MEPERDIEKTLRDYARQRQDAGGTPPALHPATRRLLQDEVARHHAGARRGGGLGLFWASWPGFILKGSVALAVLVVGALVLTPLWRGEPAGKPAIALAKNELGSDKKPVAEKKETMLARNRIAETPAPATAAPRRDLSTKADRSGIVMNDTLKDGSAAARTTKQGQANSAATAAAPKMTMMPVAAPVATPATAAAVPAPVIAADSIAQPAFRAPAELAGLANLGPISQQFTRVNPPAGRGGRGGGAALRATVLQSFRVEQNGGQIRVIDSDGSIYAGVVTLAGNLAAQSAAAGARSIAPLAGTNASVAPSSSTPNSRSNAPRSNTQVASAYYFHVTGTNLTLNQPVEFSGNFVTNDPAASTRLALGAGTAGGGRGGRGGVRATGAGGGGGGGIGGGGFAVSASNGSLAQTNLPNQPSGNLGQATGGAVSPAPLFNFRLQGQAVIGTNQVGITALPIRP